jgi:hypothetical protein
MSAEATPARIESNPLPRIGIQEDREVSALADARAARATASATPGAIPATDLIADERIRRIELLCGERVALDCLQPQQYPGGRCPNCVAKAQLAALPEAWDLGTLNQALLLCMQPAVSRDFYECFFTHRPKDGDSESFRVGLTQFRAYALLAYGNFRYAFTTLGRLPRQEIEEELGDLAIDPERWRVHYASGREHGTTLIKSEQLPVPKRWYLGYLSSELLLWDRGYERALRRVVRNEADDEWTLAHKAFVDSAVETLKQDPERVARWRDKIDSKTTELDAIEAQVEATKVTGSLFTAAYLAARHIDVYVATSMRDRWEFEGTANTIEQIFGDRSSLKELDLTYFDPTISYTESRIDKGLIEGLMLRRARVTVYMVQEGETLGKDSELAATLAHGRPVIAYLQERSEEEIVAELEASGLERTFKRMLILLAEGRKAVRDGIDRDLWEMYRAWAPYTFRLDPAQEEEREFLATHSTQLARLRGLVAKAEIESFESRLRTLTQKHPLAMQMQHRTGVASGLLVARSVERCIELLRGVLLNELSFAIDRNEFGTYLYEIADPKTRAPYRVVTSDPVLTNAFWHFWWQSQAVPALGAVKPANVKSGSQGGGG